MRLASIVVLIVASGCIDDHLTTCGELVCPAGTLCTPGGCATQDEIDACASKAEGDACTTSTILFDGYCTGGACHESICGNGIVEHGEVCDDGNRNGGDGCSPRCDSLEVCGNNLVDVLAGEECDSGLAGLSGDGCTSVCTIELDNWTVAVDHAFVGRMDYALATDVERGRVIMFGGWDGTGVKVYDDTYVFDGTQWIWLSPPVHPSARLQAAIAYDPTRKRVVLFGGAGMGDYGDTWEWDGLAWTELHPASAPSPRHGARMTFDPVTQEVVMFGGLASNNTAVAETWLWNGQTWTLATPATAPPARALAQLATDPLGHVVLFGGTGVGANVTVDDMWRWNGSTWSNITPATRPPGRVLAAFATDPVLQKTVLFGGAGTGNVQLSDTWLWDGAAWVQRTASPPGARTQISGAYDPITHAVVVPGGFAATVLSGTMRFVDPTWTTPTVPSPQGVIQYALAFDALRGVAVMHGGTASGPTIVGTTRTWNGSQWAVGSTTGPVVADAAMTFDGARGQVVLFGGHGPTSQTSITYLWDGTQWTAKTPAMAPTPRDLPAMAYDAERGRVVLFGGDTSSTYHGDTWEWDGTTWTPVSNTGPSARSAAALAYDHARRRVVLFGGFDGTHALGDTWEWDGATWTQATPTQSPPARADAGLVYELGRARTVLFGGRGDSILANFGDTWEYDGTTWARRLVASTPSPRYAMRLAYDPIHAQVVSFAGASVLTFDTETNVYAFTSASYPTERCDGADGDNDHLVGCADPDCWGRCDPLCPPTVAATCDPARPRCGDGTCSALEDHLLCPTDCPPP